MKGAVLQISKALERSTLSLLFIIYPSLLSVLILKKKHIPVLHIMILSTGHVLNMLRNVGSMFAEA